MNRNAFHEPVAIFVGLGFPRHVENVVEAHQVLSDWPMGGRGPDHETALDACRSALAGAADADTAREWFERFARKRGILAPDAVMAPADRFSRDWFPAETTEDVVPIRGACTSEQAAILAR